MSREVPHCSGRVASRSNSVQVTLPQGINGVGDIEVKLTTDRGNTVKEHCTSLAARNRSRFFDRRGLGQQIRRPGDDSRSGPDRRGTSARLSTSPGPSPATRGLPRDRHPPRGSMRWSSPATRSAATATIFCCRRSAQRFSGSGGRYTDAATVNLPANFHGDGFLFVIADRRNEVYESTFESNNASAASPIRILAPDLRVQAQLTTFTGVFGDTIAVDYEVSNAGNGAAARTFRDRIWLSKDTVLGGDGGSWPLSKPPRSAGSGRPLPAKRSTGQSSAQREPHSGQLLHPGRYRRTGVPAGERRNEQPRRHGTDDRVVLPPAADLVVENVSVVEPSPTASGPMTVRWQTVNHGGAR